MRPLLLFLLALLVFSPSLEAKKPKKPKEPKEPPPRAEQFLVPAKDSPAFKHYKQRSKNEISKLLYLLERFHNTEFKVIYDGTTYDANTAIDLSRAYITQNYHGEKALSWIRINANRSTPKGAVIYMTFPNGKKRPLRDVLIEELAALEKIYQPLK